jgi:solute carrier family 25 protein 39/40
MVGIYMPLYDQLLASYSPVLGAYAPIAAGVVSRTAAVFAVAPLDLLRTRIQATARGEARRLAAPAPSSLLARLPAMWTGFGATLARDVPFSALYWALVEPIRGFLLAKERAAGAQSRVGGGGAAVAQQQPSPSMLLAANATAGFVAGGAAAAVTTPFDVVKTRQQVAAAGEAGTVASIAAAIVRRDGVRGLFVGVGPRVARVAPACAIVIGCYELLKRAIARGDLPSSAAAAAAVLAAGPAVAPARAPGLAMLDLDNRPYDKNVD